MSEGLATTFHLLAGTSNEAAVRALTAVLDSPLEPVRRRALEALITRRSSGGKREVLARFEQLDERGLEYFKQNANRMAATLRAALLDADDPLRGNACRATLLLGEVDLIPALVGALDNAHGPLADELAAALIELAQRLATQLLASDDTPGRRDPQTIRSTVLGALERAVRGYRAQDRPELVEAFLLLTPADNVVLQELLASSANRAVAVLADQFTHHPHPAAMDLVLNLLDEPKPAAAVIGAVARRRDLEFARRLLQKVGEHPTRTLRHNLRRIRSLACLQNDLTAIDQLDEPQQAAAIELTVLTSIPRDEAFRVVQHLLLHGLPAARQAAARALEEFNGTAANDLAVQALDDPDPHVQARILAHIRRRGIPGILPRLVDKAESPHEVVRAAAQETLAEFSFKRYWGAFDMLEDDVRRTTGKMVRKIDPYAVPLLQQYLADAGRGNRLRAIEVAVTLQLVPTLEDRLIEMLDDEDHIIRHRVVAALAHVVSPTSEAALRAALEDPSETVRQAARSSLDERRLFDQWQQVWESPKEAAP